MLVPMARVQIIGLRSHLPVTLEALRRLRCLELVDANGDADSLTAPLAGDDLVRERAGLEALRTRIDALLEAAAAVASDTRAAGGEGGLRSHDQPTIDDDGRPETQRVVAELDALEPRIAAALRRIDELEAEQSALPRYLDSLRRLVPTLPALAEREDHETAALIIDARHAAVLDTLRTDLERQLGIRFVVVAGRWIMDLPPPGSRPARTTERIEAAVERIDSDTMGVVLVYPRSASAQVHRTLGRDHVTHVRLPSGFEDLDLRRAVGAIEARLDVIPAEIGAGRTELWAMLAPWLPDLGAARSMLARRLELLRATEQIAATERTFVIRGWAPVPELGRLRAELLAAVGHEVVVERMAASPDGQDLAPTLLANPGPARPFEFFVRFFALPRRRDIDPTVLLTAVMPALFGMMVGDVIYGIVLLALASVLQRRAGGGAALHGLARFFQYGSLWAILFGFIYGEALGGLGQEFGMPVLWVYRGDPAALEPLIIVSIAIGAVHVALGLVLGIWSAWRRSHRDELLTRAGMLVSLVAVAMLGATAAGGLSPLTLAGGLGSLFVGLGLLAFPHGRLGILVAPIEVLAAVGHVLSYLRIAAVGLAKAYLAIIANELAAAAPAVWLGVLIGLLLHLLNLALTAFTPTIQALRLHYVEFFSKFFDGGGAPFRPFGSTDAVGAESEWR